ncbi:IS630 family transposase [Streptomyces sp. NPDC005549]|uniref:IS630 family transposase n=1 Tax=Streptomyces sp. NPDC005549 TaxID=3154888 RepID=UPI0033A7BC46
MRRRSTPQAWALRCRIILACAAGASNKDVAAQLGSTPHAAGRWRARFVEHRIARPGDMPRSGGPRTVTDEQVAAVVKRTLESTPKNATHWSTRAMAMEMGLSQSTVSWIWRAFGLQPRRSGTFKLSTDPYFVDNVHDVVGLYLDPPERALVFCVDDKSQIQALDRSRPVLPMMPGVPQRITHDYVRAGTTMMLLPSRARPVTRMTATGWRRRAGAIPAGAAASARGRTSSTGIDMALRVDIVEDTDKASRVSGCRARCRGRPRCARRRGGWWAAR